MKTATLLLQIESASFLLMIKNFLSEEIIIHLVETCHTLAMNCRMLQYNVIQNLF